MKIRRPFAAAVLAISCAATQAHAAPMTYSQLSNFAVAVSDLTPDDGVGPSFSFTSGIINSAGYSYQKEWLGPVDSSAYLSGDVQQQAAFAQGGTSTSASANGYNLATEASVAKGSIHGQAGFFQYFTLGANTKVTFSIDWSAFTENTFPLGNLSGAALTIMLNGVDEYFMANRATDPFHTNYGESLTVEVNSGPTGFTGYVYGTNSSGAYSTASDPQSVTEPGTFGVMLGGLAALAALRRRRAR